MARGDHIFVSTELYTHHGIDLGDGTVVHWTATDPGSNHLLGLIGSKVQAEIRRTPLARFSQCQPMWVRQYGECDAAETVIARALSRVGDRGYHLADNNCEHFACWCKTGRHHSEQVKNVAAVVAGGAGVVTAVGVGIAVVSAAGPVAGLSARGTVAGLTAVGRVLGGGPAAGLVGLTTLPAAAAVLTVCSVLSEDGACARGEREARAAGRAGAVGGAVAGTAAAVGAVAGAGIPGLGEAGIASGLAALGGGNVALGLVAVFVFSAIVTLGASWLAYKLYAAADPCPGSEAVPESSGLAGTASPVTPRR
jgi:hypothetical protein